MTTRWKENSLPLVVVMFQFNIFSLYSQNIMIKQEKI